MINPFLGIARPSESCRSQGAIFVCTPCFAAAVKSSRLIAIHSFGIILDEYRRWEVFFVTMAELKRQIAAALDGLTIKEAAFILSMIESLKRHRRETGVHEG